MCYRVNFPQEMVGLLLFEVLYCKTCSWDTCGNSMTVGCCQVHDTYKICHPQMVTISAQD